MSDLVAFLRDRLDEDEAWAQGAEKNTPGGRITARVLREVEAKRRIIIRYESLAAKITAREKVDLADSGALLGTLAALRALAAVYSDHPDYDPAWA